MIILFVKEINKKTLKQFINNLEKGKRIKINCLGLTVFAIDQLRALIKQGKLHPVREEVEKAVQPFAIESVMSGEIIVPIMTYERV